MAANKVTKSKVAKKTSQYKAAKSPARKAATGRVSSLPSREPTRRNDIRRCRIMNTPFNFKGLPAEIRNMVYGHVLEECDHMTTSKKQIRRITNTNILMVNKQLHHEAADVFAKGSVVTIRPFNRPEGVTPVSKTEENALRTFLKVEFKQLDFGTYGRYGYHGDYGYYCSKDHVVLRMGMLAGLKERLTVFVDGSTVMEPHCKRYAIVDVSDLFWVSDSAELERRKDVLEQWLECLRIMRSDTHTQWKVITSAPTTRLCSWANSQSQLQPSPTFDYYWSHLAEWNAVETAYNEGGFTIVRV
ncbi:hypothetical protein BU16DRAFT_521502 [Lophium mytilinum]|uniref:F-box domain-containing protein n=1 Tax=Lophium mytilinum TaxID=390894 RepID=A0A6A6REJ9_9PEZI|nr:hypothetical protein BU16DRAFT_521502 [Lophium mytilinum]